MFLQHVETSLRPAASIQLFISSPDTHTRSFTIRTGPRLQNGTASEGSAVQCGEGGRDQTLASFFPPSAAAEKFLHFQSQLFLVSISEREEDFPVFRWDEVYSITLNAGLEKA